MPARASAPLVHGEEFSTLQCSPGSFSPSRPPALTSKLTTPENLPPAPRFPSTPHWLFSALSSAPTLHASCLAPPPRPHGGGSCWKPSNATLLVASPFRSHSDTHTSAECLPEHKAKPGLPRHTPPAPATGELRGARCSSRPPGCHARAFLRRPRGAQGLWSQQAHTGPRVRPEPAPWSERPPAPHRDPAARNARGAPSPSPPLPGLISRHRPKPEARRHGPAQGPGAPAGAVPGGGGGPRSGQGGRAWPRLPTPCASPAPPAEADRRQLLAPLPGRGSAARRAATEARPRLLAQRRAARSGPGEKGAWRAR